MAVCVWQMGSLCDNGKGSQCGRVQDTFQLHFERAAYSRSGLVDPYLSRCCSFFKKRREDKFVCSVLGKSALV